MVQIPVYENVDDDDNNGNNFYDYNEYNDNEKDGDGDNEDDDNDDNNDNDCGNNSTWMDPCIIFVTKLTRVLLNVVAISVSVSLVDTSLRVVAN